MATITQMNYFDIEEKCLSDEVDKLSYKSSEQEVLDFSLEFDTCQDLPQDLKMWLLDACRDLELPAMKELVKHTIKIYNENN